VVVLVAVKKVGLKRVSGSVARSVVDAVMFSGSAPQLVEAKRAQRVLRHALVRGAVTAVSIPGFWVWSTRVGQI
jgi:hypothetical protein